MKSYGELAGKITEEIGEALKKADPKEVEALCAEILKAESVYLFGAGRVFLSLQAFGKRLAHMGIKTEIVGSITEKPITPSDLLLIASASGESRLPLEVARIGKSCKAKVGLITSSLRSSIRSAADLCVSIPCPNKLNRNEGVKSIQPMGSLFEQCLLALGDIITLMIMEKKGIKSEDMMKRHANLE